jgi:hypothetical protein
MNSNTNTSVKHYDSYLFNTEIKNKGFVLLDEMFKQHGWKLFKNEMNWICYSKFGKETEYFEIRLDTSKVHVSIPIKNSPYQYNTTFNNYFDVSEYIESRFRDFISDHNS